MSDIFESTALAFTLPSKEAQVYALDLYYRVHDVFDRLDEESIGLRPLPGIPAEFQNVDVWHGWIFKVEAVDEHGLYMAVIDRCDFADALGAFIQHLLKKFDPTGFVQFEWSRTCSRPLPTCFSGGAAHITADEVRLVTSLDWLKERAESEAGRRKDRTITDW